MEPTFFATPEDFRAWLEARHCTASELLVGFHEKGSGRPSITWPESVDQALGFGWIDGVRRRIDDDGYSIRFRPRTQRSTWSAVTSSAWGSSPSSGSCARRASRPSTGAATTGPRSTPTSSAGGRSSTRERRLAQLIEDSAAGWTIRSLTPPSQRRESGAGRA